MTKKINTHLFTGAFILGALGIIWVATGFIGTSYLALAMTAIIGSVYVFGTLELRQFRHASAALSTGLATIPEQLTNLEDWLHKLPSTLQNAVRLRIEGERVSLPGPAMTPYLVGLLVMLGMLGTFLGMVVTLKGAVFALEKTSDLQAMRSALAMPISGLGLAFGTSVAGVIGSAMLGLMSALSRRDRLQVAQTLDTKIATVLRRFSLTHQRQETFTALQVQSQALPKVADQLQAMMLKMESMQQQLGQQLSQSLLSNQENFHDNIKDVYTGLAQAIDVSLRESLQQSAQAAGESFKPVVEAAMLGVATEAKLMHEKMAGTVQTQLDGLAARFSTTTDTITATWASALAQQDQASAGMVANLSHSLDAFANNFSQHSDALVSKVSETYTQLQTSQAERDTQQQATWTQSLTSMANALTQELQLSGTETTRLLTSAEELMRTRIDAETRWSEQQQTNMTQLASLLRTELSALKEDEAARGNAAVERLSQLQTDLTQHLSTLGTALEAPITRLIETASEAPRAAAEVITQLRQEISNSVVRDNAVLEERSRIMETLNDLLTAINHASLEQRAVIDSLVASSATALTATANAFANKVATESNKLEEIAAHVTSSAVDVASLSDTFGFAVQTFNDANEKLIASLQRIEAAMDKSLTRSDEQLAYYVAQARDIIDLSMSSQKEVFDTLRQLPAQQALLAEEMK